jgi:hypothetical protein
MSTVQEAMVALIVAVAAVYVAWTVLLPRTWRDAMRARWRPESAGNTSGGCGQCPQCDGCATKPADKRWQPVQWNVLERDRGTVKRQGAD